MGVNTQGNTSLRARARTRLRARTLAAGLAFGAVAATTAGTANAQNVGGGGNGGAGIDTHLFRPAMDSKGLFSVNGTDILGAKDMSLGLVLDYGHNLLRTSKDPFIEHSFQGTLQYSYGIANLVIVGVDMPIDLMSGDNLSYQGLGYFALHAKVRILKVEHGLGLSAGLQIGQSINDAANSGGGEPGPFVWPIAMIEKRIGATGQLRLAANGGIRAHGASSTLVQGLDKGTAADGSLLTYGVGASYRIMESFDLVAETYGTYSLASNIDSALRPSNEVVGGVKIFVERNSYLMLGGGVRYTDGYQAADHRVLLGFVFEPSIGDRDGDGIKDDIDQCPDDP
ncbi:MAG: OmpA family protein, partial [Polyangiaceae bacterium]